MRIVNVQSIVVILRDELCERDEEHGPTRRARVHERRFFRRRAGGDQIYASTRPRIVCRIRGGAISDTRRLVLVYVLRPVHVLRYQGVRTIEEQPAAIVKEPWLVNTACVDVGGGPPCPRRQIRRDPRPAAGHTSTYEIGPSVVFDACRPRSRWVTRGAHEPVHDRVIQIDLLVWLSAAGIMRVIASQIFV